MTFTLAVLPAHSDSIPPPGTFPTQFTVSGPNSDKIVYNIFADETGEFNALQSGQIDLTDTPLNPGDVSTFCPSGSSFWCTGVTPNAPDGEFGFQHDDINLANNFWGITFCFAQDGISAGGACTPRNGAVSVPGYPYPTATCANVPAPHTNDCTYAGIQWRQGFSALLNKQGLVTTVFGGAAQPLDNLGTVPAQGISHSGLPADGASVGSTCAGSPAVCVGSYSSGAPANYNQKGVCSWDSLHTNGAFNNCSTAWNFGASASTDGITWDAGTVNFCDAADHFIQAGIASGKDATTCRLTTLLGPGGDVVFAIRTDSPNRLASGTAEFNRFCDLLNAPISAGQCSRATSGGGTLRLVDHGLTITDAFTFVFSGSSTDGVTTNTPNLDWHLYTGANSGGPAFNQQWALYDSNLASTICGGSSAVPASPTGDFPLPNDVYSCNRKLDHYQELVEFNGTISGASQALQVAMEIFGNHTINNPTVSRTQQFAYLKGWQGVSDATGIGTATGNFWSLLNAWNPNPAVSGPTIRWGMKQGTSSLNPFTFTTVFEFNILQEIYDGLLAFTPYIPSTGTQVVGYLANSYSLVTHATDPNCPASASPSTGGTFPVGGCVKLSLRGDIFWQDGIQLTASDVKFSFENFNATGGIVSPATLNTVDVVYNPAVLPTSLGGTEAPGASETLYIALQSSNAFALLDIVGVPIVPQHLWKTSASSGPCRDTSAATPGSGKGTAPCNVDPNFLAGAGADPVTNNRLIGSSAFVCAPGPYTGPLTPGLGGGCTSSGTGAVTTGTITLQRYGSGLTPANSGYFRGNANYKQYLWADVNGDGQVNAIDISLTSGCQANFGSNPTACNHLDGASTTLTCTSAGPCIGASSGGDSNSAVSALEKSQVLRWQGTFWNSPFSYSSLQGVLPAPPALQDDGSTYS